MKLTTEAIKEFQGIAKEEYGIDLSEGDATVIGMRLLLLYELINQPIPDERASAVPPAGHARAAS
jgi:hypothetical protein